MFYNSKLSADPLVFSSEKLDFVSKLKAITLEKEKHQFQSARKQNPKKPIFAPANGVYNQSSLLHHPELLKKEGIHFTIGNPLSLNTKSLLNKETFAKQYQSGTRYDPSPLRQPATHRLPAIRNAKQHDSIHNSIISELYDTALDVQKHNLPFNKNNPLF